MHLWFLISGVLLLQEPLSATFVILEAIRAQYHVILIHLLWLSLTFLQIYAGWMLGRWFQRRFITSKLDTWIIKSAGKLTDLIGENGEKVALIFFTILMSPFISGFVASWLPISLCSVLFFSVLGSLLWYIQVWIGVYGADQFSSGLDTTVISVTVIGILVSMPVAIWRKRRTKGR